MSTSYAEDGDENGQDVGKMDESRASGSVWIRRGNDTKQGVDNATRDSGNNEKNSSYSLTTQFLSCLVIEC